MDIKQHEKKEDDYMRFYLRLDYFIVQVCVWTLCILNFKRKKTNNLYKGTGTQGPQRTQGYWSSIAGVRVHGRGQ